MGCYVSLIKASKGRQDSTSKEMKEEQAGNYVLMHRRKAGLSQRELGRLVGYDGDESVSRHEKSRTLPPLPAALGYEIIFGVPVGQLFPGLRLTVQQAIEERLAAFEHELQEKSSQSSQEADRHAQKFAWLDERRATSEA